MSLISRLALLFVGIPLLELFILVRMGEWIGFLPTVGLVVLTGFAGAALARLEGLRTLWSIRGELARGRLPGSALLDGLAILVGGALLLTPGILTDLLGLAFLLPPTRRVLLGRITKSLEKRLRSGALHVTYFSGFPPSPTPGWGSWPFQGDAPATHREGESPGPRPGEIVVDEPREGRDGPRG